MLVQPNRWSCFPAALAMVLGVEVDEVLRAIGHDGSEVLWPDLPEPECRRSFHQQEIVDAADGLGFVVACYERDPVSVTAEGYPEFRPYLDGRARLNEIIVRHSGVITGRTMKGKMHAVAWDGRMCHDPTGCRYALHYFDPDFFFRVEPCVTYRR